MKMIKNVGKMVMALVLAAALITLGGNKAKAAWVNSGPGTIIVTNGQQAVANFQLSGSTTLMPGMYNLGQPVVVWASKSVPTTTLATISIPSVPVVTVIYNGYNYGNFIATPTDPVLTVNCSLPVNTAVGTQFFGTVYEPLQGQTSVQATNVANVIGTVTFLQGGGTPITSN